LNNNFESHRTFVEHYDCLNEKVSVTILKAFPSAHSSFGVYHALFLAWYLECRFQRLKKRELFSILKFFIILWGLFIGISRYIDNRHHWWDILAGYFIGASVSFYTVRKIKKIK
jgi:phosphatidate phosphatase